MAVSSPRNRSRLLAPIAKAFGRRLAECGPTPKGVYWSTHDGQALRFEVLLGIIAPADAAAGQVTINDFGCGYGALFDRLEDDPCLIDGRYTGYDISPAMIAQAHARINDRRADFVQSASATRKADYSLVSGTYNMSMTAPAHEWRDFVFDSLRDLWKQTGKGLAFNMLAGSGADRPGGLYYANAGEYFDFCTAALSRNVELVQGYGLDEWTLFVRR